jgi:hypothetical protein
VDFESAPEEVAGRLLTLGARAGDLADLLSYVRPDRNCQIRDNAAALYDLVGVEFDLAVLGGITNVLALERRPSIDGDDYAQWLRQAPKRIARATGAGVLLIDHVVTSADGRGRFAIGTQHKMAGLDGAAFTFEPLKPLGEGLVGTIGLHIAKDRGEVCAVMGRAIARPTAPKPSLW